ncbi:hypothetical protein CNMCM6106_008462 [Aspergillus hiratsukae]|uniref:Cytochrome P450 n=1 Tax=Aspergillus hiratsukae TaxID=1194566 RepID=A0A8H6V3T2_9EURO|nr:hypothetical protein CNMCM6106_008462 [Aspergillus hiratsukae]
MPSVLLVPGPTLWIAFPLVRDITACLGYYDIKIRQYHERYGEILRYGPNDISFTSASAWKDIYGHRHPQLPKAIGRFPGPTPDILIANDTDHARFRKALSYGFSDRGLRAQEDLIKVYIDLLIEKLHKGAATGTVMDMVKWYNLTTFDIIGDLSFGELFHGLESEDYHSWVKTLFLGIKMVPFQRLMEKHPLVAKVVEMLLSKGLRAKAAEHSEFAQLTAMKRVERTSQHGRDDELAAHAFVLIFAGSETTATLLSGVTYWLLQTPDTLRRAIQEVRSTFESDQEINFASTAATLPYMEACLTEGLRMYPPVPTNIPRMCLPEATISVNGFKLPPGTTVSVHHSAAYWSARNFYQPRTFAPERWLPAASSDPGSVFYNDNRGVFQPFSFGPRNCIGRNLAYNEMRVILAKVLWNFDLELCEESHDWAEQKSYVLWEKPGLLCRLRKRDFEYRLEQEN